MSDSNGSADGGASGTDGSNGGKRLVRLRDGRMVAGVCAGLARYFGVDVNVVRLGFGVFSVFWGAGILIYLLAWMILPEQGEGKSILEAFLGKLDR